MKTMSSLISIRSAAFCALAAFTIGQPSLRAADHRDGPNTAHDAATDLADVYFFQDPVTTGNLVVIATFHGFIVPGEAGNEAIFDPIANYRFEFYNDHVNTAVPSEDVDGKAAVKKFLASIKPARVIDVSFSARTANLGPMGKEALQVPQEQTATAKFTGFKGAAGFPTNAKPSTFTGLKVLNPSLSASSPDPTTSVSDVGTGTGIKFFAGEVDDPFFFDIPGFSRTVAGIRDGTLPTDFLTNTSFLGRGRDTFAGYNALAIAFSIPKAALGNADTMKTKIGVNVVAQRHNVQMPPSKTGAIKGVGAFKAVDRMGNPAINVAFVPFNRKNEYNAATPKDDASGKFAGDIVASIKALNSAVSDATVGALAGIAVFSGDLLKLDTATPASWPNGRKLTDDVIDTALTVLFEGTVKDNVDANDVAFETVFPFLGKTQQPRANGTVDDNTRN